MSVFIQQKSYERLVENKAKNFKQFLNRKDNVSIAKAKAYLNLIDAIQKSIPLIKASINPVSLQTLINNINEKKIFMERNWLVKPSTESANKKTNYVEAITTLITSTFTKPLAADNITVNNSVKGHLSVKMIRS